MTACGSAVMSVVLKCPLLHPAHTPQVSLIFGNITEEDILLRTELDALVESSEGRFKVGRPRAGQGGLFEACVWEGEGGIRQGQVQGGLRAEG